MNIWKHCSYPQPHFNLPAVQTLKMFMQTKKCCMILFLSFFFCCVENRDVRLRETYANKHPLLCKFKTTWQSQRHCIISHTDQVRVYTGFLNIEGRSSLYPLPSCYMLEITFKVQLSEFDENIAPTVFHSAVDQFNCSLGLLDGDACEDCEYSPSGPIQLEQGLCGFLALGLWAFFGLWALFCSGDKWKTLCCLTHWDRMLRSSSTCYPLLLKHMHARCTIYLLSFTTKSSL